MLAIVAADGHHIPLDCDDYCIVHNWNGWEDEVKFSLPRGHPQMRLLTERVRLVEKTEDQTYALSSINVGRNYTDYEAVLDLDSLCTTLLKNWNNYVSTGIWSKGPQPMADTLRRAISDVSDWSLTVPDKATEKLAIEKFTGSPLELVQKAVDVWKNYPVRFLVPGTTSARQMIIVDPGARTPNGTYFTDELNLTEQPYYKGKAETGDSYYTALLLYGKSDISVEAQCHDYDSRVIWHSETDSSISNKSALKIKADAMVKAAAFPKRSYSCKIADLARLAPDQYAYLSFGLYDKVVLMDRDRHTNTTVQVAQYTVCPYHAEKNAVQLNSVAGTISSGSKSYSGDVIEYTDPDTSEASNADP